MYCDPCCCDPCCCDPCCFCGLTHTKPYTSILDEVREHDYSSTLPVIEDLQHVPNSRCHGSFGYYVRLLLLVTYMDYNEMMSLMKSCIYLDVDFLTSIFGTLPSPQDIHHWSQKMSKLEPGSSVCIFKYGC